MFAALSGELSGDAPARRDEKEKERETLRDGGDGKEETTGGGEGAEAV